jgi:hypothetical protein
MTLPMLLPAMEIFHGMDKDTHIQGLGKVIQRTSYQSVVSKWYRQQSSDYTRLKRIKIINPEYGQRITHILKCKY